MPSGILTCCTGPFLSGSLCLFGFCLPSLRCLISALTQAVGGDLVFRFASSIQPCCGEGGALQADVAVCGEHSPCSGRAARSFGGLSPGAARLFPPRRAAQAARGLCALTPGAVRLFPPRPQCGLPVGSQEVFRQEPGPVCNVGGGGFSGAQFAPFLLPAASHLQRGWGGSSLEFLSLRTAGGVFRSRSFLVHLHFLP